MCVQCEQREQMWKWIKRLVVPVPRAQNDTRHTTFSWINQKHFRFPFHCALYFIIKECSDESRLIRLMLARIILLFITTFSRISFSLGEMWSPRLYISLYVLLGSTSVLRYRVEKNKSRPRWFLVCIKCAPLSTGRVNVSNLFSNLFQLKKIS